MKSTSFLIRSKRSRDGDDMSSCPVTPAVLPTPIFSPLSEFWIDMANEEWGVDGYGSMKGLIRLRSRSPRCDEEDEDDAAEYGGDGAATIRFGRVFWRKWMNKRERGVK